MKFRDVKKVYVDYDLYILRQGWRMYYIHKEKGGSEAGEKG